MENELIELLKKLVEERDTQWHEGREGWREHNALEAKAIETGCALIKLIHGY